MIQKYSLFQTEKIIDDRSTFKTIEKCFIYLETFDGLEQAQIAQKENKNGTLILPSY